MNKLYQYKVKMDGPRKVSIWNRKFLRKIKNQQKEGFIDVTGDTNKNAQPSMRNCPPPLST